MIRNLERYLLVLPTALVFTFSQAQQATTLPEPLTLEAALAVANNPEHFQIRRSQESLNLVLSESEANLSDNDVTVNLSGRLRKVGVSDVGDPDEDNDSVISLFARKPLYDFGKSSRLDEVSQIKYELAELEQAIVIEQRELDITRKYLDVINADNEYLRHNEDLAIGFIRWDRARENLELGLTSELDVIEKQAAYERIRQHRYGSENRQRLTRIILAEAMGYPDSPPSELAVPDFNRTATLGDDVDKLVEQALQYSLAARIQQKKLQLATKNIELASDTVNPSLKGELEYSEYAREGGTRDDWRATIYFDVPLYSGRRESSRVAIAQSRHRQALSDQMKLHSDLRIQVLELWQTIRQSRLELDGALINQEYRDMYLDRSRAEYELEFKSDLGDAMVEFSNSRMLVYRSAFEHEMAWRKLEKLVGKTFLQNLHNSGDNNG